MDLLQSRQHADVRHPIRIRTQCQHNGKLVNKLSQAGSSGLQLRRRPGYMPVERNAALNGDSGIDGLGRHQIRQHCAGAGHRTQFQDIASTLFHFLGIAPCCGDTSGVTGKGR